VGIESGDKYELVLNIRRSTPTKAPLRELFSFADIGKYRL
jgi:hypothetical protein